jgi:hypothetical protein
MRHFRTSKVVLPLSVPTRVWTTNAQVVKVVYKIRLAALFHPVAAFLAPQRH